jgi:hypothetical protein
MQAALPAQLQQAAYSHSMVLGGLLVMSYTTRLTLRTCTAAMNTTRLKLVMQQSKYHSQRKQPYTQIRQNCKHKISVQKTNFDLAATMQAAQIRVAHEQANRAGSNNAALSRRCKPYNHTNCPPGCRCAPTQCAVQACAAHEQQDDCNNSAACSD